MVDAGMAELFDAQVGGVLLWGARHVKTCPGIACPVLSPADLEKLASGCVLGCRTVVPALLCLKQCFAVLLRILTHIWLPVADCPLQTADAISGSCRLAMAILWCSVPCCAVLLPDHILTC
jgi:hypothetical protein